MNKFEMLSAKLSPERPIRTNELLRGRTEVLADVGRELRYFHAIPFIYGYRGVGKTSLARTAAQLVTKSDREHVYVACAPQAKMLQVCRDIGEQLLKLIYQTFGTSQELSKVEITLSISPSIRTSFERRTTKLEPFEDINGAVRVLKDLSEILRDANLTAVVIDELEQLEEKDRGELAYLIKQIGDQEFKLRFILVGIAENVHELIGAHASVPRYLKEVSLSPLTPQDLIDIVQTAADEVEITVPMPILYRIAIIGNGYPHFAHLMGKALLTEALLSADTKVSSEVYNRGVVRAVKDSIQELRIGYETATQRGGDHYKQLIWALAHSDTVDVRIDEWLRSYHELESRYHWPTVDETKLRYAIGNFKNVAYARIVMNTPSRYGSTEQRYRYKRFSDMLMRGHVRLQAESEGVTLGRQSGL